MPSFDSASEGRCCINRKSHRGQALVELAFQIPLMLALMFGGVEIARVFYVYHTLQKALRGGAACWRDPRMSILQRKRPDADGCAEFHGVETCKVRELRSFAGLDARHASRSFPKAHGGQYGMYRMFVHADPESCDACVGSRAPDFVVVNLGSGFPLSMPFPYVNLGTVNLKVSVTHAGDGG